MEAAAADLPRIQERRFVSFDLDAFADSIKRERDLTIRDVIADLKISEPTWYQWRRRGRVPYLVYRALVVHYLGKSPDDSISIETGYPSRLDQAVARLAEPEPIEVADLPRVPEPAPETVAAQPPLRLLPAEELEAIEVDVPGIGTLKVTAPKARLDDGDALDVLAGLCVKLKLERDAALRQLAEARRRSAIDLQVQERRLTHRIESATRELRAEQETNVQLRARIKEAEALLDQMTHPDALAAVAVPKGPVADVKQRLEARFPTLAAEVAQLPFRAALSPS
jgi:hypothetical protein